MAEATITPEVVSELETILKTESEDGHYVASEEETETLTTETEAARKSLKTAAAADERATETYKLIARLVLSFCLHVIRPGTVAGFTVEGPDWSRQSQVCKDYSAYLIDGPLASAKVTDQTRKRVQGAIRAHLDSWAREEAVKSYVASQLPEGTEESSEAFKTAVETQYARFGLKLPGTTRSGGSGGGSGSGSENPATTLATVAAHTAVSDKVKASDKVIAAHRLIDGVIASLIAAKGAVADRPAYIEALDGLWLAVSTLHEHETNENTSTDYSALASVMLSPPKAEETPEETPEATEETPEETPKAKAKATK